MDTHKERGEKNTGISNENFKLLELDLIERKPRHELDERTRDRMRGIGGGDVVHKENKIQSYITITYHTQTGEIMRLPAGYNFGDYSILRTWVEITPKQPTSSEDRSYYNDGFKNILLHYPGDWPTPQQYTSAIAGEEVGPDVEDRRLLPERLYTPAEVKGFNMGSTDPRHYQGMFEPWGQSKLLGYNYDPKSLDEYSIRKPHPAPGDEILLRSIRLFNDAHGPPK